MTTEVKSTEEPFKMLRGSRVLLELPEEDAEVASGIILSDATKAAVKEEKMGSDDRWTKLKVFRAGSKCEDVVTGDLVYIQKAALEDHIKSGRGFMVINEVVYLMVGEHQIDLIH